MNSENIRNALLAAKASNRPQILFNQTVEKYYQNGFHILIFDIGDANMNFQATLTYENEADLSDILNEIFGEENLFEEFLFGYRSSLNDKIFDLKEWKNVQRVEQIYSTIYTAQFNCPTPDLPNYALNLEMILMKGVENIEERLIDIFADIESSFDFYQKSLIEEVSQH